MTTKTAIYLRVSTDEQLDGYGLASQLTRCEDEARRKGYQTATIYSDEGISGTRDEKRRPGLAALLAAVDAGEVKTVIVSALDRIGRDTGLTLRLVDRISKAGAEIVSAKESFDTTTPSGKLMMTLIAAIATWEKDTIKERMTDGRNERGKVDGEKGGRVPMGFARGFIDGPKGKRIATGEVFTVDGEASTVRRIFALRAAGATLTQIADELNSDGIATRRGGRWHASSVREVLLNEDDYRGGPRNGSGRSWPVILA